MGRWWRHCWSGEPYLHHLLGPPPLTSTSNTFRVSLKTIFVKNSWKMIFWETTDCTDFGACRGEPFAVAWHAPSP